MGKRQKLWKCGAGHAGHLLMYSVWLAGSWRLRCSLSEETLGKEEGPTTRHLICLELSPNNSQMLRSCFIFFLVFLAIFFIQQAPCFVKFHSSIKFVLLPILQFCSGERIESGTGEGGSEVSPASWFFQRTSIL